MKFLLILLFAFPAYSQMNSTAPIACTDAQTQIGRQVIKAVKRFKPAYKRAEVFCTSNDIVLTLELSYGPAPQRTVSVVHDHLQARMASLGLTRLVIEGRYWEPNHIGTSYQVAPTTVITTRTGSGSVSTSSGGQVTERNRYEHRRKTIVAIVESSRKNSL